MAGPRRPDLRLARIQDALGIVVRRARDGAFHETLGERVGHPLEGPFYSTLARLHMSDGCTVSELAAALNLEVSSMSRRIQTLEREGLLRRETGTVDRRTAHLWLTAEGRDLFATLQSGWRQMLAEVTADWPENDIETFSVLFERFAGDFEQYATSATAPAQPRKG
jgi:DNA-binding MarR family transcriptional regulator